MSADEFSADNLEYDELEEHENGEEDEEEEVEDDEEEDEAREEDEEKAQKNAKEDVIFSLDQYERQYEKNMKGCRFLSMKAATIVANISFGLNAIFCIGILVMLKMVDNFHFKPQSSLVNYQTLNLWCTSVWGASLVNTLVSYALLLKILAVYKSRARNLFIATIMLLNIALAAMHIFSVVFVPARWSSNLQSGAEKNFERGMKEFFVETNFSQFVFAVDVMQEHYQCCGQQDYREWFNVRRLNASLNYTMNGNAYYGKLFDLPQYSVPLSCCKWENGEECKESDARNISAANIRTRGCLTYILAPLRMFMSISVAASALLAILCIPIVFFCFGLINVSQLKNEMVQIRDASNVNDVMESVALIRSKFAEFAVKKMHLGGHFTAKQMDDAEEI